MRDGGFSAYLDPNSGWSWSTSLFGANRRCSVCNVHADQDFIIKWPKGLAKDEKGMVRHTISVRQQALPPEVTSHLWNNTTAQFSERSMVVIPVGKVADFKNQPMPMDTTVKGMTCTNNHPTISTTEARTGKKSMVVKGTSFPNPPQVVLKGGKRYRVEG